MIVLVIAKKVFMMVLMVNKVVNMMVLVIAMYSRGQKKRRLFHIKKKTF